MLLYIRKIIVFIFVYRDNNKLLRNCYSIIIIFITVLLKLKLFLRKNNITVFLYVYIMF